MPELFDPLPDRLRGLPPFFKVTYLMLKVTPLGSADFKNITGTQMATKNLIFEFLTRSGLAEELDVRTDDAGQSRYLGTLRLLETPREQESAVIEEPVLSNGAAALAAASALLRRGFKPLHIYTWFGEDGGPLYTLGEDMAQAQAQSGRDADDLFVAFYQESGVFHPIQHLTRWPVSERATQTAKQDPSSTISLMDFPQRGAHLFTYHTNAEHLGVTLNLPEHLSLQRVWGESEQARKLREARPIQRRRYKNAAPAGGGHGEGPQLPVKHRGPRVRSRAAKADA